MKFKVLFIYLFQEQVHADITGTSYFSSSHNTEIPPLESHLLS